MIGNGLNSLIPSNPSRQAANDEANKAVESQNSLPQTANGTNNVGWSTDSSQNSYSATGGLDNSKIVAPAQGQNLHTQNTVEQKVEQLESISEIEAPAPLPEIDPIESMPILEAPHVSGLAIAQHQADNSTQFVNQVPSDPINNDNQDVEGNVHNVLDGNAGELPIKEIYQEIDEQNPPKGIDPMEYPKLEDDEFYVRKLSHQKKHFVGDAIFHIEVEKIKPNPYQPRKIFDEESLRDLSNSIREFGVLQPLMVSKIQKETESGTDVEYQLIAGERRLRAAKMAGLERVPVTITQTGEKKEHLEIAIIENLQRSDLDLIETARAYARLQDEFRLTQREVALRLGKSREAIANTLRLLSLPSEIQDALSQNRINESQARLLLSVDNPMMQKQLFQDLLVNNLSVRDLRNKIRMAVEQPQKPEPVKSFVNDSKVYEMQALEQKLKDVLGTDVKIDTKGEGGKIVISFYSPEEIYGLIHKINPNED